MIKIIFCSLKNSLDSTDLIFENLEKLTKKISYVETPREVIFNQKKKNRQLSFFKNPKLLKRALFKGVVLAS